MSDQRNIARTNCCREDAEEVILNEFDPNAPVEITKGVGVWRVFHKGTHYRLVWPENLDELLRSHLVEFFQMKLRKGSPSRLQHYAGFIRRLDELEVKCLDLSEINKLREVWRLLGPYNRIILREFLRFLSSKRLSTYFAPAYRATKGWKARHGVCHLEAVLKWHPDKGALSSAELELARRALTISNGDEDLTTHHTRVFGWVILATLRRTAQVAEIRADGLREVVSKVGVEYFLIIPKAKFQARDDSEWERIPPKLAKGILEYRSLIPSDDLAVGDDVLLPIYEKRTRTAKRISSSVFRRNFTRFFDQRKITSPRTGEPLKVNMRR